MWLGSTPCGATGTSLVSIYLRASKPPSTYPAPPLSPPTAACGRCHARHSHCDGGGRRDGTNSAVHGPFLLPRSPAGPPRGGLGAWACEGATGGHTPDGAGVAPPPSSPSFPPPPSPPLAGTGLGGGREGRSGSLARPSRWLALRAGGGVAPGAATSQPGDAQLTRLARVGGDVGWGGVVRTPDPVLPLAATRRDEPRHGGAAAIAIGGSACGRWRAGGGTRGGARRPDGRDLSAAAPNCARQTPPPAAEPRRRCCRRRPPPPHRGRGGEGGARSWRQPPQRVG